MHQRLPPLVELGKLVHEGLRLFDNHVSVEQGALESASRLQLSGGHLAMAIQHISAVTLAVDDMARAINFYRKVGFELLYGGDEATFTSFRVGEGFLNLILAPSRAQGWWGRVIFRVAGVDALYVELKGKGLNPDQPRHATWGERYFHIKDPDGHELSFAELLRRS